MKNLRIKWLHSEAVLRFFFSIYIFFTSMDWALQPKVGWLKYGIKFFRSDLIGNRVGTEVSNLWFKLNIAEDLNLKTVIFAITTVMCIFLMSNRFKIFAVSVLLLVLNVMAYSASGRAYPFDLIGYAFIGYWCALIITTFWLKDLNPQRTAFYTAINSLATVYTLAGISKIVDGGLPWVSYEHMSRLLYNSKTRFELGMSTFEMPQMLFDFFNSNPSACVFLMSSAVILEAMSIFTVFLRKNYFIYMAVLFSLHLGLVSIINIFWPPILMFFFLMLIPWNFIAKNEINDLTTKELKLAFTVSLILLMISWLLPGQIGNNKTKIVWPFSTFSVYSNINQQNNYHYFKDQDGNIYHNGYLVQDLGLSYQQLHVSLKKNEKDNLCSYLDQKLPTKSVFRERHLYLWQRSYPFDLVEGKIKRTDVFLKKCF